ncbi:MAG: S-adenosylmethionine:tRNA ribosyltransferase-isomerase [Labilithrix sp.]|nr:S-adenosylmethionine:tRNA ribosyltransferase-isomerase [Labilithrix sp.]
MSPATAPRRASAVRVLELDVRTGRERIARAADLPALLERGDLVVVNDAATLPASLRWLERGEAELRLVAVGEVTATSVSVTAALLGAGDHRVRTEDRGAPPKVRIGERLTLEGGLTARVTRIDACSDRLVDVTFEAKSLAAIWQGIYRAGHPVQYAHVSPRLALWDVQNVWAARPWAVEMPSAGRALTAETLVALDRRGVAVAAITHAAGLSSTGDPAIDARLPLPERFEVSAEAALAVRRTRARGGRVLAVGTSVVRALESASRASRSDRIEAARGITNLILRPGDRREIVDGVLTGVHEADTTHFTLLGAFAEREALDGALALAERAGLLGHEFGDAWLVWGVPAGGRTVTAGEVGATFAA